MIRNSKGSPDIFTAEVIFTSRATTKTDAAHTGSGHLPVLIRAHLGHMEKTGTRENMIPGKQRSHPRSVELAKEQYKLQLPECAKCIQKAQNPQEIEEAYEELKRVVLKP